jgi:hypothetical protein
MQPLCVAAASRELAGYSANLSERFRILLTNAPLQGHDG